MRADERTPATLLFVHPHPDDESISCGGVLARASDGGDRTVVVTCTGGEEGENLSGIDLDGRALPDLRREEMAEALRILGVADHHWLGYRDSGMDSSTANDHPDSFHRADVDEAAARLAAIIRTERPSVVVSDDRTGTYGHPDHVKAHLVAVRAVAMAADADAPVAGEPWQVAKRYVHSFGRERLLAGHNALLAAGLPSPFGEEVISDPAEVPFGVPDDAITTEVAIGPWLARKQAAMAAHRTQVGEDSFFLNAPEDLARIFFAVEQFVLEEGTPGEELPEGDLLAGLEPSEAPGPAR
jgi:N-acetyl-1-D-myo-inositol-2-amino-2-deoxy-alpha-D-glucopyranoside deacetylase